jgi:Electron transfer DM13
MKKILFLAISHALAIGLGFALGIYALPILTAPDAPSATQIESQASQAQFTGQFRRDLKDSDLLHWGEGTVSVGRKNITLMGRVSPGPDYKLYLSPEFVETEADFSRLKEKMVRIGDVKTFENFIVPVPESVDPAQFNAVIVWCESFSQFITAAKYR